MLGAEDGEDLTDKSSVEPQLLMLEGAEQVGQVIHRNVATMPEFEKYLREWLRRKYRVRYPVAYMAFHGVPGGFYVGDEEVSLERFAELIGPGNASDRIFYFGSCKTLQAEESLLRGFCRKTGAKAVVGYANDIDWRESAAFDVLLLPALSEYQNMKSAYKGLVKDYGDFVRKLGLRMANSAWATELETPTQEEST